MLIESIEGTTKGKWKVTREDGRFITLYTREVKSLRFVEGGACEEAQWQIGVESVITRAKKRVFHLLAKRDYTENELSSKLEREGYDEPEIELVLHYFRQLGYVNDHRYTEKYLTYYKTTMSLRMIQHKLKNKGIPESTIKLVIEETVAYEDELNAARRQANKKYGGKELQREAYPKMVQFLLRKGFDYSIAQQAVAELFGKK